MKNFINRTVAILIAMLMTSNAFSQCIAVREEGLWQNLAGDSPFHVRIQPRNCEAPGIAPPFFVTVWVRQTSGALYQRGIFPAQTVKDSQGANWIYTQYGVGGYLAHQWVKWYTFNNREYLRVWIYFESLDIKPNATEDQWFGRIQ